MAPITMIPAHFISNLIDVTGAGKLRVLDIAAGHGMYGITLAQRNPLVEVTALDWPHVLEVARENARTAGVIDRYSTVEGSAFDADFGSGYDVILITNFLHHFDKPTCETFLRKVRSALNDSGKAITLEFVPNEDRVSPRSPALFSMVMLVSTPGGDAYTFSDLESMFRNAGFLRSELHDLPGSIQQVVISTKM
jgi:cyclopropane fatty-acyl-phospholipid synthase-like methyltransferase